MIFLIRKDMADYMDKDFDGDWSPYILNLLEHCSRFDDDDKQIYPEYGEDNPFNIEDDGKVPPGYIRPIDFNTSNSFQVEINDDDDKIFKFFIKNDIDPNNVIEISTYLVDGFINAMVSFTIAKIIKLHETNNKTLVM